MNLPLLANYLAAFEYPGTLRGLVSWPKFSFLSFLMVSRLKAQGISPATVIDCGANVGQFAVATAKILGCKLYSIEPLPESFQALRRNLKRFRNVETFQCALGERSGEIDFNVYPYTQACSVLSARDEAPSSVIRVPIRRLDEVLSNKPLPRPLLLKLDVQGYEIQVLRGATGILDRVDYILAETAINASGYVTGQCFDDLREYIVSLGFSFLGPLNVRFAPRSGRAEEMDCLFGKRTV